MRHLSLAAALAATLLLTACNDTPPPAPPATLSFANQPKLSLNVGRIDVVEEYKSPQRAPNIEHKLRISPASAMQLWVRDRLRAQAAPGSEAASKWVQVIIKDASVTEKDLPKTSGFKGYLTNDQDKQYDASIAVEVRVYGSAPLSEANAEASARRNITLPENASPAQRNAAIDRLIIDTAQMLDATLEKNMQSYMSGYLRSSR
jgi:hypothetical protein